MGRFAVVDDDGLIVNVVVWDGVSDWSPGDGVRPVEVPDGKPADIGGRVDDVGGKPVWVRVERPERP